MDNCLTSEQPTAPCSYDVGSDKKWYFYKSNKDFMDFFVTHVNKKVPVSVQSFGKTNEQALNGTGFTDAIKVDVYVCTLTLLVCVLLNSELVCY